VTYYIWILKSNMEYYLSGYNMRDGEVECQWTPDKAYKVNFPNEEYAQRVLDETGGRGIINATYDEDERWN